MFFNRNPRIKSDWDVAPSTSAHRFRLKQMKEMCNNHFYNLLFKDYLVFMACYWEKIQLADLCLRV